MHSGIKGCQAKADDWCQQAEKAKVAAAVARAEEAKVDASKVIFLLPTAGI